jgi:hypothetical protein
MTAVRSPVKVLSDLSLLAARLPAIVRKGRGFVHAAVATEHPVQGVQPPRVECPGDTIVPRVLPVRVDPLLHRHDLGLGTELDRVRVAMFHARRIGRARCGLELSHELAGHRRLRASGLRADQFPDLDRERPIGSTRSSSRSRSNAHVMALLLYVGESQAP